MQMACGTMHLIVLTKRLWALALPTYCCLPPHPTHLLLPHSIRCAQASELASAVADMLSAAGMPLDLDKQQLLQTALAANSQLQQVRFVLVQHAWVRCWLCARSAAAGCGDSLELLQESLEG